MEELDIRVETTAVGDRYVMEAMRKGDFVLGGEQSGHIIFLNHTTTGDGILTAIQLVDILVESRKSLAELRQVMKRYPQILENVRVRDKHAWRENEKIQQALKSGEELLGNNGRVLVRESANAAARSLRAIIQDRKRRESVAEVVGQARQLQLEGKVDEALEEVDRALADFPGEQRLVQLQGTLRNSLTSGSRVQTRNYYLKQLREILARVSAARDANELRGAVDQARGIAARFPEDAEFHALLAHVEEQAAKQHAEPAREEAAAAPGSQSSAVPSVTWPVPRSSPDSPEAAETSAIDSPAFYAASALLEDSETTVLPVNPPSNSGATSGTPPPLAPPSATPGGPPPPPPVPPAAATPLPPVQPLRPQSPAQRTPPVPGPGVPKIVWLALGAVFVLAIRLALLITSYIVRCLRRSPRPSHNIPLLSSRVCRARRFILTASPRRQAPCGSAPARTRSLRSWTAISLSPNSSTSAQTPRPCN